MRWKFAAPAPVLAGVTPTGGGLVFSADLGGHLRAFDADTGKVLWALDVGQQNFNAALGVGCDHCHVMPQGAPPDFASDDKDTKKYARAMMKITQTANASLAEGFGIPASDLTRINCITCHRGVATPKQIGEILAATSARKASTPRVHSTTI